LIVGLLVFTSLLAIPSDKPSSGDKFMALVMLEFLIGLCVASLPVEILAKPFSYCLPGHRAVPREFLFWVGMVTSIPGSLMFLAYPRANWWEWAPAICLAAFFAGLALYWIGAGLVFGVRNSSLIVGFVWVPLFGVTFFELHAAAERVIVGHPFVVVTLGLSVTIAVWIWLGDPNWARRLCASGRIFIFDGWNRDKIREHARRRAAAKGDKSGYNLNPQVERFFLDRMDASRHPGPGRYIWGGLYTTYGLAFSRWKTTLTSLAFALAALLYLSYSRPGGTDILFVMVGIMVMHVRLPVNSSLMISGGRSERFLSALVLAGSITALVTVAFVAVAALSAALAPIMPEITIRGVDLTFHVTSLRLLILPAIIVPIVLALRLVFRQYAALSTLVIFFSVMFFFRVGRSERVGGLFNPALLAGLLILSWLVLVFVLRHVCMKQSLVRQSRAD